VTNNFNGNVKNNNSISDIAEYTTSGAVVNTHLIGDYIGDLSSLVVATPTVPVTPASTQSSVTTGTAYSPASVTPVTSTGGLNTTVSLVGGAASSAKTVTLGTTNLGAKFISLASDVVT